MLQMMGLVNEDE